MMHKRTSESMLCYFNYTVGIEVQELYEMLTDPGLGAAVEEDSQLPSYLLTYLQIII